MLDPSYFDDPKSFQGFRFVGGSNKAGFNGQPKQKSQFTDASMNWLVWGSGKTVW